MSEENKEKKVSYENVATVVKVGKILNKTQFEGTLLTSGEKIIIEPAPTDEKRNWYSPLELVFKGEGKTDKVERMTIEEYLKKGNTRQRKKRGTNLSTEKNIEQGDYIFIYGTVEKNKKNQKIQKIIFFGLNVFGRNNEFSTVIKANNLRIFHKKDGTKFCNFKVDIPFAVKLLKFNIANKFSPLSYFDKNEGTYIPIDNLKKLEELYKKNKNLSLNFWIKRTTTDSIEKNKDHLGKYLKIYLFKNKTNDNNYIKIRNQIINSFFNPLIEPSSKEKFSQIENYCYSDEDGNKFFYPVALEFTGYETDDGNIIPYVNKIMPLSEAFGNIINKILKEAEKKKNEEKEIENENDYCPF